MVGFYLEVLGVSTQKETLLGPRIHLFLVRIFFFSFIIYLPTTQQNSSVKIVMNSFFTMFILFYVQIYKDKACWFLGKVISFYVFCYKSGNCTDENFEMLWPLETQQWQSDLWVEISQLYVN